MSRYISVASSGLHREHKEWEAWSKKRGVTDSRIPALKGHRFNIQFVIAARVFELRDHILEFIQFAPNMVFLKEFMNNDLVIVQIQILGLLDQKLTGPLWRVAENTGVVEAGQFHREFLSYIDACIDTPARFFSDECPTLSITPTFELFKVDGTLLKSLVTPNPSLLACTVSVRVLRACAKYLRDVLSQTLTGGEYSNPDEKVAECVKDAPTTNRAVESAFAYMDYTYHRAPNMRFFRREAITCFVLNHIREWLDGMGTQRRTLILEKSLESVKQIVHDERQKTEDSVRRLLKRWRHGR